MRRTVFLFLTAVLAGVIFARALLPEPAEYAMAEAEPSAAGAAIPAVTETAGSGLISELNEYFFSRPPGTDNEMTGALRGKNLVLLCADAWTPDIADGSCPVLARLWREGAKFTRVYRADWYQGMAGREFALFTGLVPTRVDDGDALSWTARQDILLPFTLARCLGGAGYAAAAFLSQEDRQGFYEALGFAAVYGPGEGLGPAAALFAGDAPFFAAFVLPDGDGEAVLAALMEALEAAGRGEDTAVCVLTGNTEAHTAQLFLWAGGLLGDAACGAPCSELDVTPTLLNLFGADWDARFLSGCDLFSRGTGEAEPLVSLSGSAWSDWITGRGSYIAGQDAFFPEDAALSGEAAARYAQAVCRRQYERYIFARRALEADYFRLVFG